VAPPFVFEDMHDGSLAALSADPERVLEAVERGETLLPHPYFPGRPRVTAPPWNRAQTESASPRLSRRASGTGSQERLSGFSRLPTEMSLWSTCRPTICRQRSQDSALLRTLSTSGSETFYARSTE